MVNAALAGATPDAAFRPSRQSGGEDEDTDDEACDDDVPEHAYGRGERVQLRAAGGAGEVFEIVQPLGHRRYRLRSLWDPTRVVEREEVARRGALLLARLQEAEPDAKGRGAAAPRLPSSA